MSGASPVLRALRGGLAAAVAAAGIVACGDGAHTAPSLLTVDDRDFLGAVGDARLSLSEAIELASGTLELAALGAAERLRVVGEPGANRSDVIRFERGLRVTLRRRDEPVVGILPPLTGEGDEIDGTGATIDGAALGDVPQASQHEVLWITDTELGPRSVAPLFTLAASNLSVHDLIVENVPGAAFVVAGAPGGGVRGVRLSRNTVQGLGRNSFSDAFVVTGGTNVDGGIVADVVIEDNLLRDVHAGVAALAGIALGDGEWVQRCRIQGLTITRNRIERALTAVIGYGVQASLGARGEDNALTELAIEENVIDFPLDVGIILSGAQPFSAADGSQGRIENVRIANNLLSAPSDAGRASTGLFVSAGQVLAGGSTAGHAIRNLLVEGNRVEGLDTGLLLTAGDAERCGPCAATGGVVDGVTLRGNVWRARSTGILAVGGASLESAGVVADNEIRSILLENEDVEAGVAGIVAAGGFATSLPLGGNFLGSGIRFPGYREPGEVVGNRLVDLTVRNSAVRAPNAIVIQGGSVTATEDTVRSSRVARVTLTENVVEGETTGLLVIGGVVVDAGQVASCEVASVEEAGNVAATGEPVAALVVQQAVAGVAPPESVADNRVVP